MYYQDLTKYTYSDVRDDGKRHLNIGWLDFGKDYPKGEVPPEFIKRLEISHSVDRCKGSHYCPFCERNYKSPKEKHEGVNPESFWKNPKEYIPPCPKNSGEYLIETRTTVYHAPKMIIHYIKKHNYRPPQEFIDAVMNQNEVSRLSPGRRTFHLPSSGFKGKNESIDPHGGLPLQLGPYTDTNIYYNPRVVGNFLSSDPGYIVRFNKFNIDDPMNVLENDPDETERKRKKKIRDRKKILKFKEFEGVGFGRTDYRDVTGAATTSGYLNDKQPIGHGRADLASDIPRGDWHEPSTVLIGITKYDVKDKYFNNKLKRIRNKKKKNLRREIISNNLNDLYKNQE